MLSHRERVLTALNHQQTDRVPIDLGGTQTGILIEPYNALKQRLGIDTPSKIGNFVMGLVEVEDAVLERFDIDFRHVLPGMSDDFNLVLLPDDSFYDEFGTRWRRPPGGYYYDMVEFPLSSCTCEALEKFKWPDPLNPGRVRNVREKLVNLRSTTDFALEAGLVGLWETSWFTTGLSNWLMALNDNPEFVTELLDKALLFLKQMHGAYLDVAGQYLDMVTIWDDYGAQNGSLISSTMWQHFVKPRLADLITIIRSKTDASIAIHSCGSISSLLDDFVEIGIQVINPVQVSARNMNLAKLKKRYSKKLTFWGGIDTYSLLPQGTVTEVRKNVSETIGLMSQDGGYILAAVHNIQPGVPSENIISMYDTARSIRLDQ